MRRISSILFICFVVVGCSTKKKAFLNRAYHNTTARYNGYFNAKEKIKESLRSYKEAREENFDETLPIFPAPTEEERSALLPNMNKAIEKTEKVISRHSMEIGGKEYCKWIDNNYLAKGIGHFYKGEFDQAASTFNFIAKKYKEGDAKPLALAWLVRTHIEQEEMQKANLVLGILNKEQELKRKSALMRQKVNALYHIKSKAYPEAISRISNAIGLEKKKDERMRMYFIKAQLHQRLGNANEAIADFRKVVQKSPNYELAFNAGISQATAVQGSANSFSVKKDLEKLLKDDKNIEYQDQIYYALAEIEFTERNYPEAVEFLQKSIKSSINNNRQKGKSFYRLARYYFNEKLYQPASIYYDSTLAILPKTHPEFEEIENKSNNLQELVVHLNLIQKNDSILEIANLAPEEQDKKLEDIIQKERERLLKEQREKEIKAQKILASKAGKKESSGSWYFYNAKAKLQGYKEFKDKWGDRTLQDNWRIGGNSGPATTGTAKDSLSVETKPVGELKGLPSYAQLRKDLPKTDKEKQKLVQETKSALYQSGLVYKENFEDVDNAIESFENLLARYDSTVYRLPAYYQLYRLYLAKETNSEKEFFSFDTKSSSYYYKDLILYEYPDSEFARIIKNPDRVASKQANEKEAQSHYSKAYLAYQIDSLDRSMKITLEGISKYSASDLLPKFYFLKARIHSEQREIGEFEQTLSFLAKQFRGTPEGKEAERLLALLRKAMANSKTSNSNTDSTSTAAEKEKKEPELAATTSNYTDTPNSAHYYLVVIPKGAMNTTRAKVEVANFNGRFFSNKKMDVSVSFLTNELPILLVRGLDNKEQAKLYHQAFIKDKNELRVISRNNFQQFAISEENFKMLFVNKDIENYLKFFENNY
ncbi:type IX secretion system periplasmic lipoprotein PorW/SprE [Luteibaculum oceani]|uniref:Tetratricopeptide repeat protein n=1 Tax=Luteibaculum oceani TaxID=1294296 RepID=A0A5C6VKM6_9FLAO|nr:tetratricopeptide repeat protein [Luteibaculum oceani]TXC85281.1 tetratricopeptide repeat protein [Luteibaculum oceani]